MEFVHEGVKITLSGSGEFFAVVGGVTQRKPSLDAMKKFITQSKKTAFKEFAALVEKSYNDKNAKDGLVKLTVMGVEVGDRATKYREQRLQFITDGERYRRPRQVMVDSNENREAFKAAEAYDMETAKINDARKKELGRLKEKIKWICADDFKVK